MSKIDTKRQTIDAYSVLKGVSILFVVSIHVLYKFHGADKPKLLEAFNYVIGFAVPLFMIIGGFFLTTKLENINSAEDIKLYFKHLFKRILVPYYIFCLILTLFQFLTNRKVSLDPFLLIGANAHGLYFIITYVYAYAIAGLLFYIITAFSKLDKRITLFIILPLIGFVFFPLNYISYFIAGFPMRFICRKLSPLKFLDKMKILSIIIAFCFMYTWILYSLKENYGKTFLYSGNSPTLLLLIYSICVFLILYIILNEINILVAIGKKLLIDRFGEQSLFVFYIHPYFMYLLPDIFNTLHLKSIINTNMFVFPWIILTYLITLISLKIYDILPVRIQKIFSR